MNQPKPANIQTNPLPHPHLCALRASSKAGGEIYLPLHYAPPISPRPSAPSERNIL
jgi:hypothetical protein